MNVWQASLLKLRGKASSAYKAQPSGLGFKFEGQRPSHLFSRADGEQNCRPVGPREPYISQHLGRATQVAGPMAEFREKWCPRRSG